MVVCPGGSETRPGIADSVYLTAENMLALLPPPLAILKPFVPYIPPILVSSLVDFCDAEPPGWPDLTTVTFSAVLAGNAEGASIVATAALTQILLNAYWYVACKCSAIATPAPPATPTVPPQATVGSPGVGLPSGGGCLDYTGVRSHFTGNGAEVFFYPQTAVLTTADFPTFLRAAIPASPTTYIWDWDTGPAQAGTNRVTFTIAFYNSADALISSVSQVNKNTGDSGTVSAAIPGGTAKLGITAVQVDAGPYPSAQTCGSRIQVFCGSGAAGAPPVPCCPPDPILTGMLQQILNGITLVQRQAVPFAYLTKTAHPGLTGNGNIEVQGLIGCRIDVTTLPASLGRSVGTPTEYFDMGFITWGTDDGYPQSVRIEHNPQLSLPQMCSAFTDLAYTLPPGVVVTLTELVREP